MATDLRRTMFASRRFTHANFFVADLDAAVSFWSAVGSVEVMREESLMAAFFTNGGKHHDIAVLQSGPDERLDRRGELVKPADLGAEPELNHLAWELATEADLVAGHERVVEHGVEIEICLD